MGYTSAGKSTLLNLLAASDVEAHARLFATLDPTTRRVDLDDGASIVLSDTVGFIRNLPHHLVAAFRATLEEVVDADFLIHVVDASHHFVAEQRAAVAEVIGELGVQDKPVITVFNKSDKIRDQYELRKLVVETEDSCYMSALTGEGRQYLETLIHKAVSRLMKHVTALVPHDRGDLVAACHERGRVASVDYLPEGVRVEADLPPDLAARLAPFAAQAEE